jgi:glycosyltransferase involved in cell wall biosynthesis
MQATIDRCLRERTYDIIQVEFSQMAYYRFPSHANCVLDQHNVEYEILYRTYRAATDWGRRLYSFVEWKKFKRDEINNCRKFPVCLTTSERDKQVLAADLPLTDFKVIPNGVDCTYFSSNGHETEPQQPALIFTGTINYHPNTDGLKYFLEDVFPLIRQQVPDVKFYIVGRQPPPEIQRYDQSPNIIVTGGVDDTRPYFEKATVVVVPLRIGGGTRLKLLEAMAMGKPVVSTSIGAEGTAVTPGQNIMLADEPGSFAQATVALLKKAALRKHLAVEGRKLVEEKYDWRAITQKLEQTYESLLNRVREPSEISRGGL